MSVPEELYSDLTEWISLVSLLTLHSDVNRYQRGMMTSRIQRDTTDYFEKNRFLREREREREREIGVIKVEHTQ